MIRDVINNYKRPIETPQEMVSILSRYRDDLMTEYSTKTGWYLEDALPCLDMILRLDKEIRHYNWIIQYGPKDYFQKDQ